MSDDPFGDIGVPVNAGRSAAPASLSNVDLYPDEHGNYFPASDRREEPISTLSAAAATASSMASAGYAAASSAASSAASAASAAVEEAKRGLRAVEERGLVGLPPPAFEVTVSDPEKKGEGVYAHVSYKVNTKTATTPGQWSHSSVVRRYSDFAWLQGQLEERYPGYLIPPLPDKAIMGRFTPMFVDSRRRALELFLNRLARHPQLAQASSVHLFLHGGQEFYDAREGRASVDSASRSAGGGAAGGAGAASGSGAAEEAPKKKSLFSYFTDVAQTVTSSLGGAKERPKTEEDLKCDAILAYADSLETSLTSVHGNVETLVKGTKTVANTWFEFGMACTLLGQFETQSEERNLGLAFAKLGNCADRLSVLLTQKVDTQIIHFLEPLDDMVHTVRQVKAMLKARNTALTAYHTEVASLDSLKASLARSQGRAGREARAIQQEAEVQAQQVAVQNALTHLQTVTRRVFEETLRFRREKRLNTQHAISDFIRTQIDNSKKVQAAWESILAGVEELPVE